MSDHASYAKEMALLALMERTSYNIVQENGQRRYGPPPNWIGPPPPKGCEVFVGKIPRDLYEDELVPIFERIGRIYEVRLMMDFSGSNRGYAFVMYTNIYDAKRAIGHLDNYEIRKNRFIGVCKSIDNCRLFVGGIPKNKSKDEVLGEMRRVTDDVSDVILYSNFQDKTKNRGFAFVEYENHRAAAMARRKLIPGKILLWGQEIAVDWAEPEPEVEESTMLKVTVLYVRNISPLTSEDRLRVIFSLKNSLQVDKVKKMRDFGFVHFAVRTDAETALSKLNGVYVDGSVLEVTWAKPANKSSRQRFWSVSSSSSSSPYERGSSVQNFNFTDIEGLCNGFSHLSTTGLSRSALRLKNQSPLSWSSAPTQSSSNRFNGMYSRPLPTSHMNVAADSYKYRTSPNAIQILEEYCLQNNLGEPRYYLQTFEDDTSDYRTLYAYKQKFLNLRSNNVVMWFTPTTLSEEKTTGSFGDLPIKEWQYKRLRWVEFEPHVVVRVAGGSCQRLGVLAENLNVAIPGLSSYKQFFVPNRLTSVCDDAKLIAAEYILKELVLPATQDFSPWNTPSAIQDPLSTLSHGSHVAGTYSKVSNSAQVDLGQGDVGSFFSGTSSVCSALQAAQSPITKPHGGSCAAAGSVLLQVHEDSEVS